MSDCNDVIKIPLELLYNIDKEYRTEYLKKETPLNYSNYQVSMDHKIVFNILKSAKYDYETMFKNNPNMKKLNFIKRLLTKFEILKQNDVFSLTMSPFIKESDHIFQELKELREDCLNFLDKMINLDQNKEENQYLASMAQVLIGICYEHGILGLPLDYSKSLNFYESASRLKSGWANFRQAQCYEKGIGTERNINKAIVFYRISAKMGYIEALHVYGAILLYGHLNVLQDIPNAIFFLSMAAKKATLDYPFAFFDLAQFYEGKVHSDHEDIKYALELYTIGADKGCPNCLYRMGMVFEFSHLNRKMKMSKSISYYMKAADYGHKDALIAMAAFHSTGLKDYVIKDPFLSFKYAFGAAIRGNANAAFIIAEYIEKGEGTPRSSINALWWYMISSSLGHKGAKEKIKEIKSRLAPAHSNVRRFKFF